MKTIVCCICHQIAQKSKCSETRCDACFRKDLVKCPKCMAHVLKGKNGKLYRHKQYKTSDGSTPSLSSPSDQYPWCENTQAEDL